MARTKGFDPDVALERAMQTFWTRGYEATSTQDLVDALGINRSSLYATFRSKDDLYRQALRRYTEVDEPWVTPLLEGSGPFRERLRDALLAAVANDLDPKRSRGCFVGNAAVERAHVDARVRRLVVAGLANVRTTFAAAVERARDEGELAADADVEGLAAMLLTFFEGLRVIAKGSRDRAQVERAVETFVSAL